MVVPPSARTIITRLSSSAGAGPARLSALLSGTDRFSDLTAAIPGLSNRLLSERLKELEAEGVLTRIVVPEMPVRIQYQLSEKGRALVSVVDAVSDWAETWVQSLPALSLCSPCEGRAIQRARNLLRG